MITMGNKTTGESVVTQLIRRCDKSITIEFNKDGDLDWDFDIVITYTEDTGTEEKEIVLIKVDEFEVGNKVGDHYDIGEDLSSTIDEVLKKQYPDVASGVRNGWSERVEAIVVNTIEMEGIDW